MSKVLGKDVVLFVRNNNTYDTIACGRQCSFTSNVEIAGKSTIGSGLFREYKALVNSASISADGIVSFDDNMAVSSLRSFQMNFTELLFQFRVVDEGGEGVIYAGTLLITSITETGSYNDMATYSIQAVVTGQWTITSTVGNPDVIYFNTQDNGDNPIDFTQFITGNPDDDIIINYDHLDTAKFYWMAHSVGALQKTNWEDENDTGNAGTIGGTADLFAVRIIQINGFDYILYITNYVTFFNGFEAIVKFYRIPAGCLPPDNFAITSIVNNSDTGGITEVATVNVLTADVTPVATVLTAAGVSFDYFRFGNLVSSIFTLTGSGKTFTYTGSGAINASISFTIQGMRHSLVSPFLYQIYINGVAQSLGQLTLNSNAGTFDIPYVWFNTVSFVLNPGDTVKFGVTATLSGSDVNYLLTQTLGNISIDTGDAVDQEFQITGAPQAGGVFTGSIYSTSLQYEITVAQTNAEISAAIVAIINAANIAVPIGNQPPSIVSASVDPLNTDMFIVSSGTGDNASFSYLPASLATVTFNFDEPVDPGLTYTIRIINVDVASTFLAIGGIAPREVGLRRGYTYKFAIRTDCENGSSDWTADIVQVIP